MLKCRVARNALAGAVGALAMGAAVLNAGAASAAEHYSEWFAFGDSADVNWMAVPVEGDGNQVVIQRKFLEPTAETERVMVMYTKPSSAYEVAITKILEIFEAKEMNVQITVVNVERDNTRAVAALDQAAEMGSGLIFSMGSDATAWLWEHYRGGSIPVVSVCSKDPVVLGQINSYEEGTGTNFAFTSLNMPIEVQMAYVLELKPDLKNFGVLVDGSNVSAVETQANPIAEFARSLGVQVLYLEVKDSNNAQAELVDLVGGAVSAMERNDPTLDNSVFWITGSTSVFREIQTINAHANRVPVLSVVPEVVQGGPDSAVLSIGVSFESNAHLAAVYGADVLQDHTLVGQLPVGIVSPPDIAINFLRARAIELEVPFTFFESANTVYDNEGMLVRSNGESVVEVN